MPAVVHPCECDGGHHNNYSSQGLRDCGWSGGGSGNGSETRIREDNKDHGDDGGGDEKSTAAANNAESPPPTDNEYHDNDDDDGGEGGRRRGDRDQPRQQQPGPRRRRRRQPRRCPETAEFDTGQISVSLRGRGEPRLIQVRMCKGCWQNFKRRSDRTLDYWAWECYPRGLLPGTNGDEDCGEYADDEVVIVRLARLWPTAIWSELGSR